VLRMVLVKALSAVAFVPAEAMLVQVTPNTSLAAVGFKQTRPTPEVPKVIVVSNLTLVLDDGNGKP